MPRNYEAMVDKFFNIPRLTGRTVTRAAVVSRHLVTLFTADGGAFAMFPGECLDNGNNVSISISNVDGDPATLEGLPLLKAEGGVGDLKKGGTRTVFRLATAKGEVVVEWHGHSNGFYGETAELKELTPPYPLTVTKLPHLVGRTFRGTCDDPYDYDKGGYTSLSLLLDGGQRVVVVDTPVGHHEVFVKEEMTQTAYGPTLWVDHDDFCVEDGDLKPLVGHEIVDADLVTAEKGRNRYTVLRLPTERGAVAFTYRLQLPDPDDEGGEDE